MTAQKRNPRKAGAGGVSKDARKEWLKIADLHFDSENPRIKHLIGGKSASQESIYEILLQGGMDARELVPSFIQNGYLPYEPFVVRPKKSGKYVVIEGNRRLAALRSMSRSDDPEEVRAFKEKALDTVPCLIFEGTPEDEIAYLGLRHLSKTKDWSSAAKAEFVERVLRSGMNIGEAARFTNTSRPSLMLLLLTRRLFERAAELGITLPDSTAEGEVLFWHLGDAIRRTNAKAYLKIVESKNPLEQPELDEGRFEKLVGWIYGNPKLRRPRIISSIRDIPDLAQCLGHPKSIDALERGLSISEALEEAQLAGATVSSYLDRAKDSVQRAMRSLSELDAEGRKAVKVSREALRKAIDVFDKAFGE